MFVGGGVVMLAGEVDSFSATHIRKDVFAGEPKQISLEFLNHSVSGDPRTHSS